MGGQTSKDGRQCLSVFAETHNMDAILSVGSTIAISSVGSSIGVRLPAEQHQTCIYLDYNATSPIFPEVAVEMTPFLFTHFGNPSSGHVFARPCAAALKLARERMAKLIGCDVGEILFTSCGSESDNHAITGVVAASRERLDGATPHVVASTIEHPAILECLSALQTEGRLTYTLVPVDAEGLLTAAQVAEAMTPNTVLVTIMHSNNEIGTLQPIGEISKVAKAKGAVMHTDAAQSFGKVPVKAKELGADLITCVGHKFGAPKGVAALYVRKGTPMHKLLHGGGQESGLRAGTENVLLISGLGKAADLYETEASSTTAHLSSLRDHLQATLVKECTAIGVNVRVNGPLDDAKRLPNTLSISVEGLSASVLLHNLQDMLAASAGAACHTGGGPAISGVLKAIDLPEAFALGTLRLSVGRHTCREDVDRAVDLIMEEVNSQCLQPKK
eukprot:CAMPEP_0198200592 /NCGR_PEP_ID=MMETSP1445-20131203/3584_1 /TAXON_ID=36898 /ORGANISM="Pyramimonas sp., Strain CCMP2087" /LENGTH=444 /DNA_ID=CAMNT_0043870713 /DNA_START=150 /DNA_END=1484 /DNA_ORIENTATION=-